MGANLPSSAGTPEQTLAATLHALAALGHIVKTSSLYRTAPVGILEQPPFLNAVLQIQVQNKITPHILLSDLLRIERDFGRDRSHEQPMGPRTLDLDLLLYDDYVISTSNLTLPHPRMHERAFVLIPLAEIAPQIKHPVIGLDISQLLGGMVFEKDQALRVKCETWPQSKHCAQ